MKADEVMNVFEATGALLKGHFELRSKLHSDQYFQCANALRYPRVAERLCAALVDRMRAAPGGAPAADTVIAPAMGGILVGHEVARALGVKSVFAEKENGRLIMRRFRLERGERVLVAEDVVTRGGRVDETIRIVRDAGAEVVGVAILVDRSGGTVQFDCPVFSLMALNVVTWEPAACPLCARGVPFQHPGS